MNQTSVIGGSLLLAFVVFVIVRGELPCYFQVLGVATDAQCPQGQVSSSGLSGATPSATQGTANTLRQTLGINNTQGGFGPGNPFGGFEGIFTGGG